MNTEKIDVLVIGAGPAGCIAASLIHKNGLTVRVVEKTKFPRFVIGESLLPRVMDHLDEAGLLEDVKAAGFQKKFGAKFVMGDKVCDFNLRNVLINDDNAYDNVRSIETIIHGIDLQVQELNFS